MHSKPTEVPVISIATLVSAEGKGVFVAALVNGAVRLFGADMGALLAEIGAHSRQINGLACHPARNVFATCGDDTFMNLWQIKYDGVNVNVDALSSTRVPDFFLTGVCFAGKNHLAVVCSAYDYKQLIVWDAAL